LWVALSTEKSVGEIRAILEAWFSELVVADWDLSSIESVNESLERPAARSADMLFRVVDTQSEFPTAIHIDRWPGFHDDAVVYATMTELARMLAVACTCRTICDGSAYVGDYSPYWAIIWDAGRSFLADTCDTAFEDEAGGEVRSVREVSLPACKLDAAGRPVVQHG
jgi:hypothetical protein